MYWSILIIIGSQILFTTSDLLARYHMPKQGFVLTTFVSWWFAIYLILKLTGIFGQLYIFTSTEVGKTMALFGAASIVLANVLGFLLLKEVVSPVAYIGIFLAITAFLILSLT